MQSTRIAANREINRVEWHSQRRYESPFGTQSPWACRQSHPVSVVGGVRYGNQEGVTRKQIWVAAGNRQPVDEAWNARSATHYPPEAVTLERESISPSRRSHDSSQRERGLPFERG